MQHDGQEYRAPPVFAGPRDRLVVDPLGDGRILRFQVPGRYAPPNDPLIFLHEDESLFVDSPFLRREQAVMARAESALAAGDEVVVAERRGNSHAETLRGRGKLF